jgi:hypothetical protein
VVGTTGLAQTGRAFQKRSVGWASATTVTVSRDVLSMLNACSFTASGMRHLMASESSPPTIFSVTDVAVVPDLVAKWHVNFLLAHGFSGLKEVSV